MRRTVPLTRTTPLAPGERPRRLVPLQRTSGPARVAVGRQRPAGGPTRAVRALVLDRDSWTCVLGVLCDPRPTTGLHLHHRRRVGMGGTSLPETHGVTNLILACDPDNGWCEDNPAEARALGWKLDRLEDAGVTPVRYPDRTWWLLLPDGQRRPA